MEKSNPILSKEELSKRIANLSFGSRRIEITPAQWLYRERAAVRVECDLDELQPSGTIDADAQAALQKVMLESSVVYTADGRPVWRLHHDVRRATLKRLAGQGRLVETLDANPANHSSILQTMLDGYIRGTAPDVDGQTLPELEATLQVVEWLAGCLPDLPSPDQLRQIIARERLLKPFRFLVGSHFRGRSDELRLLRDYVGIRAEARTQATPAPDQPLLIYGPGGIGKSTLISKFILEYADPEDSQRLPYVYIDFNRRDVDIQEPISLLLEAVRQLAIQYPMDEERWNRLYEQWRRSVDDLTQDNPAQKAAYGLESVASARRRGWDRYVFEFVDAIADLPQTGQPFLIVLDTLEELLYHNREYLGDLWGFLSLLHSEIPDLRVVLSGRSPLPLEFPVQALLLDGLDLQSAVDLLLERGIPNEIFAHQIIEIVGRSPLSLWLSADLYGRLEGDMQAFENLEARQEYFYQVKEYLIQGVLYRRILGHIHDPRLQALAHPGLVLRRVTPDLILNVLAEACKIEVKDIEDAQTLFTQLQEEVAVVEINHADPNEIRQRPELRLAMLELLLQDDREKVKEIHQLAVAYFEKRVAAQSPANVQDGADLVYHRLALKEPPAFLDGYTPNDLQEIANELGSAIQDLPVEAQTYLVSRVKVEIQLDPGVWEAADLESWEQMTARSVQRQLNLRAYADALAQLEKREERSLGSPLYPLQVLAQIGLGQIEAAHHTLEEGIRRTPPNSVEMQDLLLLAASMDETDERFAAAAEYYHRARHIARRLGDDTAAVNTQLKIVRLTHLLYPPDAPEVRQEHDTLLELWQRLDDASLLEHPALLRDAATQVGAETPELVKQAVRLLGLGSDKPTNLNVLASALATWDDLRSTELDQQPGVLAQQVKAEWRGDLYSTWMAYLEGTPWERIARDLVRLVEAHPLTPTVSITLVDLLKARLLLTGEQAALLQTLLADSFSVADLQTLVRTELDIDLNEVSRAKDPERRIADLVSWAETNGRLAQLLQALLIGLPQSPQLQELLDLLGISTRPAQESTDPEAVITATEEQLARARQRGDREAEANALVRLGNAYLERSAGDRGVNLKQALTFYELALTLLRAVDDRSGEASTLNLIGAVYNDLGEKQKALGYFEQALPLLHAVGDRAGEAYTLQTIGGVYDDLGEKQKALGYFEQALPLLRAVGDRAGEAVILHSIGRMYADLDEKQAALGYFEQALSLFRAGSDRSGEAYTLHTIGAVFNVLDEKQKALGYYEQSLSLFRAVGDRSGEAMTLHNIGAVYADLGEKQKALGYFEQALPLLRAVGAHAGQVQTLNNIGRVYATLGETQKALGYYEQALPLIRAMGDRGGEVNVLNALGLAYAELGETQRAIEYFEQVRQLAQEIGDRQVEADVHGNLGNAYFQLGHYEDAITHYRAALEWAETAHDRNEAADCEFFLGLSHLELGRPAEAQHHLEAAEAIYAEIGHPNLARMQEFLKMATERAREEIHGKIDTGGGAYIRDTVDVTGGDFVGRDKVVYGNISSGSIAIGKGIHIGGQSGQAGLEERTSAICRGEVTQATPTYHTAFLVGPDLVLTAYHTVQQIVEGSLPPQNLTFRFDLLSTRANDILSQGQAYALAVGREAQARFNTERPWLLAADPKLDYALLRLARPAGEETVSGLRQSRPRGWLTLAESARLASGDPLGIIYFWQGAQLTALYQPGAFLGYSENGLRIVHRLETSPGASGAPILDEHQVVVGIQRGRGDGNSSETQTADDPRRNAVFAPAVVADLKEKKLWPLSSSFAF